MSVRWPLSFPDCETWYVPLLPVGSKAPTICPWAAFEPELVESKLSDELPLKLVVVAVPVLASDQVEFVFWVVWNEPDADESLNDPWTFIVAVPLCCCEYVSVPVTVLVELVEVDELPEPGANPEAYWST